MEGTARKDAQSETLLEVSMVNNGDLPVDLGSKALHGSCDAHSLPKDHMLAP